MQTRVPAAKPRRVLWKILSSAAAASVFACAGPEAETPELPPDAIDVAELVASECGNASSAVTIVAAQTQAESPIYPDTPMSFCVNGLAEGRRFSFGYPWRGNEDAYESVVTGASQVQGTETCIAVPDDALLLQSDATGLEEHRIELELGTYFFWITYEEAGARQWSCAQFEIVEAVPSQQCLVGYTGDDCDQCDTGYVREGDICVPEPDPDQCENVTCGDHGSCSNGICNCDVGYAGASCDTCAAGYEIDGDDCVSIEPEPCEGISCGNGTCEAGVCNCDVGYAGPSCAECAPGYVASGNGCIPDVPTGWPVEIPAPWTGWDVMPANSDTMADPGGSDVSVNCTGSEGNPAGLTANTTFTGGQDGIITITASHCVIHDMAFVGYTVRVSGDHYVVRNVDIDGAGDTTKNGLRLSGNNAVAYQNRSHHLMGNDRHCYTTGQGALDMWFIENEGFACSGDGFQAGHQAEANPPTNVYIVRNHMHDNRENGLDYKYMNNVWAIENNLHSFVSAQSGTTWCFPDNPNICSVSNSGSDGSAIVVGSDGGPTDSYHLRNIIDDATNAIRVESAFGDILIEANEMSNLSSRCLALDKEGLGIEFKSNTCRDAGRGIFQNWRDNFTLEVDGNTFENITGASIEYESGSVGNGSTLTNNTFINAGPVIYNNTSADSQAGINDLPGASGNVVSP